MTWLKASPVENRRPIRAHRWEREEHGHYVEPAWCAERLFAVEQFEGAICDPCCGFGTIPKAANAAGYFAAAADVVDRGFPGTVVEDFLAGGNVYNNIVCNPPYHLIPEFTRHALAVARRKVAMLWPAPRLNAARWLRDTPLRCVWLLTPRPSMPPGYVIAAGEKPQGGKVDYCWLVWEQGYVGTPALRWLERDAKKVLDILS